MQVLVQNAEAELEEVQAQEFRNQETPFFFYQLRAILHQ